MPREQTVVVSAVRKECEYCKGTGWILNDVYKALRCPNHWYAMSKAAKRRYMQNWRVRRREKSLEPKNQKKGGKSLVS